MQEQAIERKTRHVVENTRQNEWRHQIDRLVHNQTRAPIGRRSALRICGQQFRATYGSDMPASDLESYIQANISAEQQNAEIGDPSAAVFLAMLDNRVIGYAHLMLDTVDRRSAFLNRIYVHTDWRGRGLAMALLKTVLHDAHQRGATRLELTVYQRNARAIAFYERAGFVVTGNTIFAVGQDLQSDLVMEMKLAERPNS